MIKIFTKIYVLYLQTYINVSYMTTYILHIPTYYIRYVTLYHSKLYTYICQFHNRLSNSNFKVHT